MNANSIKKHISMATSLLRRSGAGSAKSLLSRYSAEMTEALDRREAGVSTIRGERVNRLDALMRRIVESNFDGILTLNATDAVTMANDAALKILGHDLQTLQRLKPEDYLPGFRSLTDTASDDYAVGLGYRETIAVNADGNAVAAEVCISDLKIRRENLRVVILRDITESKEQRRALEHQALHDALTGLPNRVLLNDRLDHAIKTAQRANEPMALLLIDLDDFKEVNDTLGHHVGDLLLVEVAERLQKPLRDSDTVARLGGDEFAILLPAATDMQRAVSVAERLRQAILEPVKLSDDLSAFVGASIGIALFPQNSVDAVRLMQCADVAMYCAKDGPDKVVIYDTEKDTNNLRSLTLSSSLKSAILEERVQLAFQPKLSLKTGQIHTVEALARWDDPELGAVQPDEFIAHAERTGQILELTTLLMGKTIEQISQWRRLGKEIGIAINLSQRSLHDLKLPERMEMLLKKYDVPGHMVTCEITETSILVDPKKALTIFEDLTALGVRLSIDDFGTGYSSLSILQKLPVQELKVDRSFVEHMLTEKNDDVIVRSTISLAHNLDMSVVAEGAATPEHIRHLKTLGCDYVQGYGISSALNGTDVLRWIAEYQAPLPPLNG